MEKDGTLRLDLVDVFGNRLREKVDVNPNGMEGRRGWLLYGDPQGRYRIEISPVSAVTLKASGESHSSVQNPGFAVR